MSPSSDDSSEERSGEDRRVHDRLMMPLLLPAGVFLFSLLVIYGLSRIYLELNTFEVGEVTMATPLAIGVALAILGVAWYLASRPSVPRWQLASFGVIAVAALTGGSIWAAVHDEEEAGLGVGPIDTPVANGGTPTVGTIGVSLEEFSVTPAEDRAPAGAVTFNVSNVGGQIHNFRVIRTDLAPDGLPIDEAAFAVDEGQVDVIGSIAEFAGGETEELSLELEAGSYVLICNVAGHYDLGMRAGFVVE